MKTTFAIALATLLALSTWTTDATALDSCSDGKGCKSGDVCHGGLCLPSSMICTSDAGCGSYEKCDFSCPHGGDISTTTVDTSPPSSGKAEPGESSGSSEDKDEGGADFKAGGDEDQAEPAEGNGAKKPGEGAPVQPPPNSCPTAKGVCVVVPSKITASAACKSFCAVVSKCDFSAQTGKTVSGKGNSTPSTPPNATTPVPEPDKDDEGGDDEPSSDGSHSEDGDAGAPAPPSDGKGAVAIDASSCELACAIWQNKKVAVAETAALMQCVELNKTQTCKVLDTKCEAQAETLEKALEDNDIWMLALGGGWGYSKATKSSNAPSVGPPEAPNSNPGGQSESDGSAAHAISSSGGCTAGTSPVGNQGAAAFIIVLLAGAMMLRRRMV